MQQTFRRFLKCCPAENIYIVTNKDYKELVEQQLPGVVKANVLYEPQRKNTAPCVAYAAYRILAQNPEANIVVAPSDHLILKEDEFISIVNNCLSKAASGNFLVTIGIEPTRPDTGYGYIQFIADDEAGEVKKVKTFTEKPDLEMAKFFIKSGEFLWNAGIFVWNVQSLLLALEKHLPDMNSLFKEGKDIYGTNKEEAFIAGVYASCKNISVDYGIMEKAGNVYVHSANIGWSDLGTWGSLYEHMKKDDNGNAKVGRNVLMYDSSNCIVNMPKDKVVVVQGLKDYIVVESDNILLVCRKDDEQNIRTFVQEVKMQMGEKYV